MMAADFEEEARRLEQDAARCNDDRHQPPQMNGTARTLGARTDRSPTGETPHHRPEPVASLIGCVIRW